VSREAVQAKIFVIFFLNPGLVYYNNAKSVVGLTALVGYQLIYNDHILADRNYATVELMAPLSSFVRRLSRMYCS